ncbi:MAG: PAS domain-containing sensor histidine kinase [Pseudomonadota bacterium]
MAYCDDFKNLVDALGIPAFVIEVVDDNFWFRHFNAAVVEKTGLVPRTWVDERVEDVVASRTASLIIRNYKRCVEERSVQEYEEELSLPNGVIAWRTVLSPQLNAEGDVQFIVGTAVDITEHRLRERELTTTHANLARANTEIRNLSSIIAHDLCAPLRKISMLAEMIEEDFEDLGDNKVDFIKSTKQVAREAIRYATDVSNYAKTIDGAPQAHELVSLSTMVEEVLATLDPLHDLGVNIPRADIIVERVALELMIRNLLDNAIKHARSRIYLTIDDAPDDCLSITVGDDGFGLDPMVEEQLNSLQFEKGLGLRAVYQLASSRGGNLTHGRSLLGGAVFTFTLPGKVLSLGLEDHLVINDDKDAA